MEGRRLVHLCNANGSFHARVIVARLGAEGILAQARGEAVGPYPLETGVEVLVPEEELAAAREVLLFDDLEAAVGPGGTGPPTRRPSGWTRLVGVVALVVLVSMCAAAVAQLVQLAG